MERSSLFARNTNHGSNVRPWEQRRYLFGALASGNSLRIGSQMPTDLARDLKAVEEASTLSESGSGAAQLLDALSVTYSSAN